MTDRLSITGLKIRTHIGVHAWEQQILQLIIMDISIPIDCSQVNDNLNNTLDYSILCQQVTTFVESTNFQLIETLAEAVALYIKTNFAVTQLTLRVNKPNAIHNATNICVELCR